MTGNGPKARPAKRRMAQAAANRQPSIQLHIEELVLHGFSPGDRYRIGEAVQRELTRLFTEQGLPGRLVRGGEVAHPDSAAFNLAPDAKPEVVGVQVAQAVYGGLKK
jgi:hypothetical protein